MIDPGNYSMDKSSIVSYVSQNIYNIIKTDYNEYRYNGIRYNYIILITISQRLYIAKKLNNRYNYII